MPNRAEEIDAAVLQMSRYMNQANNTGQDEDFEETRLHNRPDAEHPALFSDGLVRDFVEAACANTEAPPAGVAMALLTFLSACAGRSLYLPVGDDFHHARLMFAHVARTNQGKGVSFTLLNRVIRKIREAYLMNTPDLLPCVHKGGLSTREGLAALIADPRENKDGMLEGGTEDKRVLVVETEFANVLNNAKRQGNNISTAIRDCWDGSDLSPLTKNDKVCCTDPHVSILANITPSELVRLLPPGEVSNGFANRILFILAESSKSVADPEPCPDEQVAGLAHRIADVMVWAKGNYPAEKDSRRMALSDPARAIRDAVYPRLKNPSNDPFLLDLMARGRAHVLRLGMIFAIADKSLTVEEKHFRAALAWVALWQQSCQFIFRTVANEAKAEKTVEDAEKILSFLRDKGGLVARTDITRGCFRGHASASRIDAALESLLMRNPAAVVVENEKQSGKPKGRQFIRLPSNV